MLQVDVQNSWTADPKIILYYDDDGTRVTVASATVTPLEQGEGGWTEFSVSLAAGDAPDSIGKQLGIEIDALSASSWIGVDNARVFIE